MTQELVILIGHGKMGGILRKRWQECRLFSSLHIIAPRHNETDSDTIFWHRSPSDLPEQIKNPVVVLAVKPALLAEILPAYASRLPAGSLFISLAAGKTLASLSALLGNDVAVVRAMPNTPCSIGEGMTALVATPDLSPKNRMRAEQLMQATGKTAWLADETLMDAATALSGSGPAYVFYFLEALARAGMKAGLPEALAYELATQTLRGSALLASTTSLTSEQLQQQVVSPGGTTEAALTVLQTENGLKPLIEKAVNAACKRAVELAADR